VRAPPNTRSTKDPLAAATHSAAVTRGVYTYDRPRSS
jgi:hypothetical protein